ncbi:hypothetical protein [Azospirillum argentinense]|uniref:DUF5983 family protein n=1 Tax=Azospirillum argentinense TaxID=2970906 RepID=UPI0032DECBF9
MNDNAFLNTLAAVEQPDAGVRRYLDACTSHITHDDAQLLERFVHRGDEAPLIVCSNRDYGWFVHVATEVADLQEEVKRALAAGLSEHFTGLLRHAHSLDCNWVLLDRDAAVLDALPTFDW